MAQNCGATKKTGKRLWGLTCIITLTPELIAKCEGPIEQAFIYILTLDNAVAEILLSVFAPYMSVSLFPLAADKKAQVHVTGVDLAGLRLTRDGETVEFWFQFEVENNHTLHAFLKEFAFTRVWTRDQAARRRAGSNAAGDGEEIEMSSAAPLGLSRGSGSCRETRRLARGIDLQPRQVRGKNRNGEHGMNDKRSMVGLFVAMISSLGGSFVPVAAAEEKKKRERQPRNWAKGLQRPLKTDGYRERHGTIYRRWVKPSKKVRAKAKRLLKRERAAEVQKVAA